VSLKVLATVRAYAQRMELTMSQRQAVTKVKARAYARAGRAKKSQILDELVELTPRPPTYGPRVIAALVTCWAVLRAPAAKRFAPMLAVLVPILRRDGELDLTEEEAALLMRMSAATIDRRLAGERATLTLRGRSHTKPGSLLKSQIPVRTWADRDDARPGFVEIDLVGHEGGAASGEFCFTLTVTDIATGWTVNRSVRNKAQRWVFEALLHVSAVFPFPIKGIDSDNGSEFINGAAAALLRTTAHHLHPVPAGQQERRRARRAEELGPGPRTGRLLRLKARICRIEDRLRW
jgi:hypothetical protein